MAPVPPRDLGLVLIPPKPEISIQLGWLNWICYEALGLCWIMTEGQRRFTSDILAAHLYASGVTLPADMQRILAPDRIPTHHADLKVIG